MCEARSLAIAALSICESLLLALEDRGLIDEGERQGLLEDVVAAHLAAAARGDPATHKAVARVVRDIGAGRDLARHADRRR